MTSASLAYLSAKIGEPNDYTPGEETSLIQNEIAGE